MGKENYSCDTNGVCVPVSQTSASIERQENIEIIYGYDPLCGWCYGFSSDLKTVRQKYQDRIKFTLINGGIFAGRRGVKMGQISGHINRNMPYVTQRTGTPFGTEFKELLLKSEYPYDSEKSSIAVVVFRDLNPTKVFEYASDLQKAFFHDGKDINDEDVLATILQPYNVDRSEFLRRLNSKEYKDKTYNEFQIAEKYNLAYPSCIIIDKENAEMLSYGYEEADSIIKKINRKLTNSIIKVHQK